MSAADPAGVATPVFGKLGLKILAVLLGITAWYLIQDAIHIESVQLQATRQPKPAKPAPVETLRLDKLPVTALSPSGLWEWRITPGTATVWLEGPAPDLARIEKAAVRLFVDGSIIAQAGESVMLPVRVHIPGGDGPVRAQVEPALVEVSVRPAAKGAP